MVEIFQMSFFVSLVFVFLILCLSFSLIVCFMSVCRLLEFPFNISVSFNVVSFSFDLQRWTISRRDRKSTSRIENPLLEWQYSGEGQILVEQI